MDDAPAACVPSDEAGFNEWLHRTLNRLDAIVLALFLSYWVHQSWLSGCHPSEVVVEGLCRTSRCRSVELGGVNDVLLATLVTFARTFLTLLAFSFTACSFFFPCTG